MTEGEYWLLSSEYPPVFGGGIAAYCAHTVNMLKEADRRVRVFAHDKSLPAFSRQGEENGVFTVRFNADHLPRAERYAHPNQAISRALCDVIAQYAPELPPPEFMEAHDYQGLAQDLIIQKKAGTFPYPKTQIVVTTHAPWFVTAKVNAQDTSAHPACLTGEMERFCLREADMLLAPSRGMLNMLRAFGVELAEHVAVVPNPCRTAPPPADGPRSGVFLFGKMQHIKGSELAPAAMRILWGEGCAEPLHIIGRSMPRYPGGRQFRETLEEEYNAEVQAGLLRFHGELAPPEARAALGGARLVVFPSRFDNFPYALLETMGLGLVCLAADVGGQAEMIGADGEAGFIFSHERAGDLTRCLRRVLRLGDAELAAMGQKARRRVEREFSYAAVHKKKFEALRGQNRDL